MIDLPSDVARRLRRTARDKKLVDRYWAGWKLSLTFGPIADAMSPLDVAMARATASKLLGRPWTEADTKRAAEVERDEWHLSASWRGAYPAADGRRLLGELIVALGVPEAKRAGQQPLRVRGADGVASPQVTHWTWKDGS